MIFALLGIAVAAGPVCVERASPDQHTRAALESRVPDASDEQVLARLVYAEALSTGFPDDPLVYRTIAWGTMNRVRLAERSRVAERRYGSGVPGVVFHPGQFNPAVSRRSRFASAFLCPEAGDRWESAIEAAREALAGEGNPFIDTPWESSHGLSLVVNFYYPSSVQARGIYAPWESDGTLSFLGDLEVGDAVLPAARIRFYRLVAAPADVAGGEASGASGSGAQQSSKPGQE